MSYAWSGFVMLAAAVVIHRMLVMANVMDCQSSHVMRLAATALVVFAFWEFLAPLSGRVPPVEEGAAMLSIALYFLADRRRPIEPRRRVTQ